MTIRNQLEALGQENDKKAALEKIKEFNERLKDPDSKSNGFAEITSLAQKRRG
jgi:hypothetical protein